MDKLQGLAAFVAVVEAGGFSPAARARGVAPSSLTRLVDALEAELGTTLLNRSTRAVAPTEAGRAYYASATRVLDELAAADAAVAGRDREPAGVLKMTAPVAFGRLHLAPLLPDFLARCPLIELDVSLSDGVVDLGAADLDVALRLGPVGDPALVARRLADDRRVLCAAPGYLDAVGRPTAPAELARHVCLSFAYAPGRQAWRLAPVHGGEAVTVEVRGPLRSDNAEVLREAALAALGIALLPDWLVGADVSAGRLEVVLPGWRAEPARAGRTEPAGIHALYLPNRRGAPKVRAFVAYLAERWSPPPWTAGS
jgi:DNA-binding transcriptional LysR family regulator